MGSSKRLWGYKGYKGGPDLVGHRDQEDSKGIPGGLLCSKDSALYPYDTHLAIRDC